MSGVGFSEFLILCLIGLIVLGPERLPKVASQIGNWVGQARRMTRVMRRQLEEELNFDENLNIKPPSQTSPHPPPRDDDGFSPLHEQPEKKDASAATDGAAASDEDPIEEMPEDEKDLKDEEKPKDDNDER